MENTTKQAQPTSAELAEALFGITSLISKQMHPNEVIPKPTKSFFNKLAETIEETRKNKTNEPN